MKERVQKIIAASGIASRRKAEELIEKGLVTVNGKTITLGDKADPEKDIVKVKGKKVRVEKKVYYAFHKPKNILCSKRSDLGKRTIFDIIRVPDSVFYAGRLDYDAEGLLILTNDGRFANRLTHPRHNIIKTYQVNLKMPMHRDEIKRLDRPLYIDKSRIRIDGFRWITSKKVVLSIHQGQKHIVKKIFNKLGYGVGRLKRIKVGPISLGRLKPGQMRPLSKKEIEIVMDN